MGPMRVPPYMEPIQGPVTEAVMYSGGNANLSLRLHTLEKFRASCMGLCCSLKDCT